MDQHFLFLSSQDSLNYYPDNQQSDFSVYLPQVLHLEGVWTVALKEISLFNLARQELIIYCNICEDSVVNAAKLPILKRLSLPQNRNNPITLTYPDSFYIPVKTKQISTVRIYIQKQGNSIKLGKGSTTCVLHLKRAA